MAATARAGAALVVLVCAAGRLLVPDDDMLAPLLDVTVPPLPDGWADDLLWAHTG
jgi:hypothetical protein